MLRGFNPDTKPFPRRCGKTSRPRGKEQQKKTHVSEEIERNDVFSANGQLMAQTWAKTQPG